MDLATLKQQAERCRRLAKQADPFTQKRLLDLASEYEERIAQHEPKPSAATRSLRNDATQQAPSPGQRPLNLFFR